MTKKKLFLASSSELKDDRREFEILINRRNKDWVERGVFLELIVWEDFLDAVSKTRLQDEYNRAIRECDIFVMLFWTKVGRYTAEEFEVAFGQFKATSKPFIFTYFRDSEHNVAHADQQDLMSLRAFQQKLDGLGHFYTAYKNTDALTFHFSQQLDKLAASGFIEFTPDRSETAVIPHEAKLTGNGAIAQGTDAVAVGSGAVFVGGRSTGAIITGSPHIDTGGGAYVGGSVDTGGGDFVGRDKVTTGISHRDLEPLFAPLAAAVAAHAPSGSQASAMKRVQELEAEIAKGTLADDSQVGRLVDGLVAMVPGAVGAIVSMFATPILGATVGPVTKFVLDKLKAS